MFHLSHATFFCFLKNGKKTIGLCSSEYSSHRFSLTLKTKEEYLFVDFSWKEAAPARRTCAKGTCTVSFLRPETGFHREYYMHILPVPCDISQNTKAPTSNHAEMSFNCKNEAKRTSAL